MNTREIEVLDLKSSTPTQDEVYDDIPICINDIINICREYNKLGWQIQDQIETILEVGVEESIEKGIVQRTSLSYIKNFLCKISDNPYFGDAVSQAQDCIKLIKQYEADHKIKVISRYN